MGVLLKVLVAGVGALVVASVVTGLIASSSADKPPARDTIVIDDQGRTPDDEQPSDAKDPDEDEDDIHSVRIEPDDLDDTRRDRHEDRREARGGPGDDLDDDASGSGEDSDD